MSGRRDPRRDPIPGDVITAKFSEHKVLRVENGVVHYRDEGLNDYVPIERWRKWYAGRDDCEVIKRGDE